LEREILIDGRVLKHKATTGVERYAEEIISGLRNSLSDKIDVAMPESNSRYLQHLWEHIALPAKATNYKILFCPANICPLYKPKYTKFITTIHDLSFLYYPESFSRSYKLYYKSITPRVLKLSDIVVTVSNYEKNMISLRYPLIKDRINVIYSGVDVAFFAEEEEEVKKEDYILYVGNLSERKNFAGLLDAFRGCYKELNKRLVVVGMTPGIMRLSKRVQEILKEIPEEYIEFKGQINDKYTLSSIYRKASVFVFPSFYESFGFPPLEAMASGTPVVVSNRGALPEICGDAVFYVDPEDHDSIAYGMLKVAKDGILSKNLIEKGKHRAEMFKWSESVKKHVELLRELS